jgi:hypothetical protein
MKRKTLAVGLTFITCMSVVTAGPVEARSGDVAAGLLGGLAVGAIVGSAIAAPRPYYYAPAPVYALPPPPPECYWTRGEPMWDGYRWVRPRVQVCD